MSTTYTSFGTHVGPLLPVQEKVVDELVLRRVQPGVRVGVAQVPAQGGVELHSSKTSLLSRSEIKRSAKVTQRSAKVMPRGRHFMQMHKTYVFA